MSNNVEQKLQELFDQWEKEDKELDVKSKIIDSLYRWIDRLQLKEPTLDDFAHSFGNEELRRFAGESMEAIPTKKFESQITNFAEARKTYLRRKDSNHSRENNSWINP